MRHVSVNATRIDDDSERFKQDDRLRTLPPTIKEVTFERLQQYASYRISVAAVDRRGMIGRRAQASIRTPLAASPITAPPTTTPGTGSSSMALPPMMLGCENADKGLLVHWKVGDSF